MNLRTLSVVLAALSLAQVAAAQNDQHKQPAKPATAAEPAKRIGDPYPLDTCPITNKKLGSMGDPVVKLYDGREIRFCCGGCPGRFEDKQAAHLAKIDEKITADQAPLYPLTTSLITDKPLPAKPIDWVYGNRLIRLADESEKAEFLEAPKKHLATLDAAVIAKQGKDYPLKACPISGEELGADKEMTPKDVVLAGRLVRLCCAACEKSLEKDAAKHIKAIDAARAGKK